MPHIREVFRDIGQLTGEALSQFGEMVLEVQKDVQEYRNSRREDGSVELSQLGPETEDNQDN